jgi:hypothetical protein
VCVRQLAPGLYTVHRLPCHSRLPNSSHLPISCHIWTRSRGASRICCSTLGHTGTLAPVSCLPLQSTQAALRCQVAQTVHKIRIQQRAPRPPGSGVSHQCCCCEPIPSHLGTALPLSSVRSRAAHSLPQRLPTHATRLARLYCSEPAPSHLSSRILRHVQIHGKIHLSRLSVWRASRCC